MRLVRSLATVALLVAIWGCAAPSPSGSPAPSPSAPIPSVPSAPSATPDPSAPASPAPEPSSEPSADPTPSAPQLPQDSVARVVTNDLRVRSLPEVSDASKKLEPLLDAPRLVFVIDGPIEASGYTWYEVAPIGDAEATVELPIGWVAAADKDGTPWIRKATLDCPDRPTTVKQLWSLDTVLGLACFGETPITFDAKLAQPEATCGVDIGWTIQPDWLGSTCPNPAFLVHDARESAISFESVIDPKVKVSAFEPGVEAADWLPVTVTGRFDHPAAADCKGVSNGEPVPFSRDRIVLSCRATFVITGIQAD
jgi:hypothetical protein